MKRLFILICAGIFLTGCATVPKETGNMSLLLGRQISILKEGNVSVIHALFDAKEAAMNNYIDNTYFPVYLDHLFANPAIQDIWDQIVVSNDTQDRYQAIVWLNKNIQIELKSMRDSLLAPIQEERKRVLTAFGEEFDKAIQMNDVITQNISSAAELKDFHRGLFSKYIDTDRIDSVFYQSLRRANEQLDSVERLLDVYKNGKTEINNLLNKE